MFKKISGSEALKIIADGGMVFYRLIPVDGSFRPITSPVTWGITAFLSPQTEYVFAVKIEPVFEINHFKIGVAADFITLHVSKFRGMEVNITVEQIG